MADCRFSKGLLVIFAFVFLLPEGQGELAIVKPYPQNIFPVEGTTASVTCIAYDTENVTKASKIDFMRKNKYGQFHNLSGEPHLTFNTYTELSGTKLFKTMLINNVTENDDSDNGKFECWVFEAGKADKTTAHGFSITVILKKYIPVLSITKDVLADPGENVVLSCNITHTGTAGLTVLKRQSWRKGDEEKQHIRNPEPEDKLSSLDPYEIPDVKPEDGGVYTCTLLVEFFKHQDVNITGKVTVSVRASFVDDIENQEVKVKQGKQAAFQCGAVGYPLQVEWKRQKKNEDEIYCINGTEDRYSITRKDINSKYILRIEDVAYEDRGKYFCCLPTNCSDSTEGCQEWTLRVKDPLGALWPFIGIVIEAILLFLIIFIAGKVKDRKEKAEKDDRVEFSYSSTDEGDRGNVRLRKMDPSPANA